MIILESLWNVKFLEAHKKSVFLALKCRRKAKLKLFTTFLENYILQQIIN